MEFELAYFQAAVQYHSYYATSTAAAAAAIVDWLIDFFV